MGNNQLPSGWGQGRGKLPPGWKTEEPVAQEKEAPVPAANVDQADIPPQEGLKQPQEVVLASEPPKEEAQTVEPKPQPESTPIVPGPIEEEPIAAESLTQEPPRSEPQPTKPIKTQKPKEKPVKPPKEKAEQQPKQKKALWPFGLLGAAAVICLGIFAGIHFMGGNSDKDVLPTDGVIAENVPSAIPSDVVEPTAENTDTPNNSNGPLPSSALTEYPSEQPPSPEPDPSELPEETSTATEDGWDSFEKFSEDDVDSYCRICGEITTFRGSIDGMCEDCWELYGSGANTPEAENSIPPTTSGNSNLSTAERALQSAKDRLENGYGWSRDHLISRLQSDGYTYEDAVYAVDHSGADWKEQAVKWSEYILSQGDGYPRDTLIDYLQSHYGYTYEEAVYAADHCGADWKEQAAFTAKSMLDFDGISRGYSRNELIDILQFNIYAGSFTYEEAVYGVDHCGADWNEQALISAINWLDTEYGHSYSGLIRTLEESDEFTHEEAVYAADHCGADWNEQALKTAKYRLEYIERQSNGLLKRSRKAMIEYLETSGGFTHEEAVYGADYCGADWKEQALRYVESMTYWYPRENLIRILEQDGFTNEEAVYAADHCGWYGSE